MDRIKKIINESVWHELGHFCLAIMIIENNPNYRISSFKFTYTIPSSWSCSVTCNNPHIKNNLDLIKTENHNELCFDILNILAGSVFESVYRRITYNQYLDPIHILTKGSAIHDLSSLRELLKTFNIHKYDEIKMFILGDILDSFFQSLLLNVEFLREIDPIADKNSKKVFEKLDIKENLIHNLTLEDIEYLKINLLASMKYTGVYNEFLRIKEKLSTLLKVNQL